MSNDLLKLSCGGWVLQYEDDPFMFVGKHGRRRVAFAHAHIYVHHNTAKAKLLLRHYNNTRVRHVTVSLT